MICQLSFVRTEGERFIHVCENCRREVRATYRDPKKMHRMCPGKLPAPAAPEVECKRCRR